MSAYNKVILMGNLTRDPELRTLPSNTVVCDFGMAVNRNWTGANGEKKEEVTFVDCSCFGKTAEVLAQYKKKGDALLVDGRLKFETWDDKNGNKRNKLSVIVENFQFIGGKRDDDEYQGEPAARPAVAPSRQQPQQRQQAPQPYRSYLRSKAPVDAGMRQNAAEKMLSEPAGLPEEEIPF